MKLKHYYYMVSLLLLNNCNQAKLSPDYISIQNEYSTDYFFGIGEGSGNTEQLAIKISKIKALGLLSENIKVTILSKTEMNISETSDGTNPQFSESFKQQIISIGNATVRSPEYEILNIRSEKDVFHAQVLAKKLKAEHIKEAANDLGFETGADQLLKLITK